MSLADKRRLFDVNFWGVVHGCRTAVRYLRHRGGAIINIGSVASDRAIPLLGMYSASKHAVKGYTDGLRMELEEAGAPVFHETFHDQPLPVERWLAQAAAPPGRAEAIRAKIRGELDGGNPTGMRPLIHDGELHLTHRYAIIIARKPDHDG